MNNYTVDELKQFLAEAEKEREILDIRIEELKNKLIEKALG